jgi:small GTP-binding protein
MPANLPPQFFSLQAKLKEVKDNEERIEILREMLAVCPKHKGTERVQEEIKKKIAKLRKVLPKKIKKEEIYFVKKEGAGQVLVIGPPNSGKTSLTNLLCQTNFKVGDYPFTTQLPTPGMLRYENILIQVVDCPPLTADFKPGWMKNLIRQADGILVLIDLGKEPEKNLREILEILEEWKTEREKILLIGNKIDLENGRENFNQLKNQFRIKAVSCHNKFGLEDLKREIFGLLKIIRVYTKPPGKKPDFSHPFVLKRGSLLSELAVKINPNFRDSFKFAKLYKENLKKPLIVGKDYFLQDGDVIEIH